MRQASPRRPGRLFQKKSLALRGPGSHDRAFFALNRAPFSSDLAPKKIMQAAEVLGVAKRF
ncbi:hypothetical protein DFAR_100005 [Desulfarculales bacterium]